MWKMNVKKIFSYIGAFLLVLVQPFCTSFYVTEEQMETLQMIYEKQNNQIKVLNGQLTDVQNRLQIADELLQKSEMELTQSKTELENSNQALKKAEKSLKKSRIKDWIERIVIFISSFIAGGILGHYLIPP